MQTLLQGVFVTDIFQSDSSSAEQYVIINDQSRARILIDIIKDRMCRQGSIKHITLINTAQDIHLNIEADLNQEGWQFWSSLQQLCEKGHGMSQTGSTREQHLQSLKILIRDCGLSYSFQYGQSIIWISCL